jgi:hypothetical protein
MASELKSKSEKSAAKTRMLNRVISMRVDGKVGGLQENSNLHDELAAKVRSSMVQGLNLEPEYDSSDSEDNNSD